MLRRILRFLGWPAAVAAAASLVLAGLNFARLERERAEETAVVQFLRAELAKLEPSRAQREQHRDKIQELLARKQIIEVLDAERRYGLQLVNRAVERRPAGVALTKLAVERKRIELHGSAPSEAAARAFASRLGGEGITTRAARNGIEFMFHAELRP